MALPVSAALGGQVRPCGCFLCWIFEGLTRGGEGVLISGTVRGQRQRRLFCVPVASALPRVLSPLQTACPMYVGQRSARIGGPEE